MMKRGREMTMTSIPIASSPASLAVATACHERSGSPSPISLGDPRKFLRKLFDAGQNILFCVCPSASFSSIHWLALAQLSFLHSLIGHYDTDAF